MEAKKNEFVFQMKPGHSGRNKTTAHPSHAVLLECSVLTTQQSKRRALSMEYFDFPWWKGYSNPKKALRMYCGVEKTVMGRKVLSEEECERENEETLRY